MLEDVSDAAEEHLSLQVMARKNKVFAVNSAGLLLRALSNSKDNTLSILTN